MGASAALAFGASRAGAFALGSLGSKMGPPSAIEGTLGTGTCIFGGMRCCSLVEGTGTALPGAGPGVGPTPPALLACITDPDLGGRGTAAGAAGGALTGAQVGAHLGHR